MSDTEEPKKPTQTKKSMDAPSAPSSSQSSKSSANMSSGLENITKKLDEIKTADQSQRAEIKDGIDRLAGSLSKDKPTKEEEKEKKTRFSKAFQKLGDTIKKSFGGLKNFGALLSGALGPLKKFWDAVKKVKGFILAFLGVFLLKTFTIKDVKQMWEGMKKFFLETKKLFITMVAFMEPIVKWFKEDFVPATFTLFIDTLDNLTTTFTQLTKDFKGFTDKGWKDKMSTIITALGTVGEFVTNFFGDVVDWTFRLMGYDGSITKNLRTWLENTFSKDFMDGVMVVFTTIVGAMAVSSVFGMSPVKFLKVFGGMIFSAVRTLFAVVYGALNPVGLTLGLVALTAYYNKEIFSGLDSALGSVAKWFGNLGTMANNAMAKTKLGKLMGLEKKEFTTKEEDTAARNKMQRENLAKAEAELKRLEDWKFKSKARPGEVGGELFDDSSGWFSQSKDMAALQKARIDLKLWKGKVAGQDGKWLEQGILKPSEPSTPEVNNQLSKSLSAFDKLSKSGINFDPSQTRASSFLGQTDMTKDKMATLASMFKGGIRVTSGFRDTERSNEAMLNSGSDFRKTYKAKYLKGITDMGTPGSEERKAAITKMRANGFMSQHEHGNALDFSYPSGYSPATFPQLKNDILSVFPGANLIKEQDHLHMAFSDKALSDKALSNAYAKPSSMHGYDLSPTKERMDREPSIQVAQNTVHHSEGDSFLADGQKHRQDENKLGSKIVHGMST